MRNNTAVENHYPYITNRVPVDGWVKKLIVPKNSPNLLYALISNYGPPNATEKTGLHIFDISDVTRITQITYFPITSPFGMDISLDEKTLFLYSAYFQGQDPKDWYGIIALDVNNPKALREIGRVDADILAARISADDKYLFVAERGLIHKNEQRYLFSIFKVSHDSSPKLLTRVKPQDAFSTSANGFYPLPGGKHLLVDRYGQYLIAFDISDPSNPKIEWDRENHGGYPKAIRYDGILCLIDNTTLILAKMFPKMDKLGTLEGRFSDAEIPFFNEETLYLAMHDKALHIVDVSDPKSPKAQSEYILPQHIGSAVPARNRNLIFVGWLGAIAVIDPDKAIVTSEQLRAAHAEALRQYQRKDDKSDFRKTRNAINVLKAAGIDQALEKKPSGISDRALAGILNDYGFFLTKRHPYGEATNIYKRAIQLDPSRVVAYLNLGDCLREQLSVADSFQEKISLTKEIKVAYLQYKKLHGKSTPAIDSFLALNPVDAPITDFCEYVAAYTNRGRLRELLLLGSGTSVKKRDDQGSMQVEIAYEGTGHYPHVYFTDSQTGQEIDQQIPDDGRDVPWADTIDIVPFLDGHHLLYHTGDYLVASEPIGLAANTGKSCGFDVRVTESWDKKGTDMELCRLVRSPRRPPFIGFNESHYLDEGAIQAAGYPAGWAQEHGSAEVDFDNDGKPETLVRLDYASTAGPGCSYDFFDLLNEEKNGVSSSKRRSLLLKMQGIEHGASGLHPVPHCRGNVTGWFRYKGTTYFETKYPKDQPQNPYQEFHAVSYIKDGKIHKVCDARFKIWINAEQGHGATPKRLRRSETDLAVNERLLQAAKDGSVEQVKTLLEKGGDVNATVNSGRTVLMDAAWAGNLEVVKLLIDKGADVNAKRNFGHRAIMDAASQTNLEVLKLLVDNGADVHVKDYYGYTSLMFAAGSSNTRSLEVLRFLIDKGVDVNAKTVDGRTALMYAAANPSKFEVVKLLIDRGADVNLKANNGDTALTLAQKRGQKEIVEFVKAHGAKPSDEPPPLPPIEEMKPRSR